MVVVDWKLPSQSRSFLWVGQMSMVLSFTAQLPRQYLLSFTAQLPRQYLWSFLWIWWMSVVLSFALCCSLHHFLLGFIVAMSQDCWVTSILLSGLLECDIIAEVVHNTPRQVPERLGSTLTMGAGECEVGGRQLLQFFEWLNRCPSPCWVRGWMDIHHHPPLWRWFRGWMDIHHHLPILCDAGGWMDIHHHLPILCDAGSEVEWISITIFLSFVTLLVQRLKGYPSPSSHPLRRWFRGWMDIHHHLPILCDAGSEVEWISITIFPSFVTLVQRLNGYPSPSFHPLWRWFRGRGVLSFHVRLSTWYCYAPD